MNGELNLHPAQRMQKICADSVRGRLSAAEDDLQKPVSRRLYRFQLEEMAKAAFDHAIAQSINLYDFESSLNSGLEAVDCLRWLELDDKDRTLDLWHNHGRPLDRIKADDVPSIDRISLGNVVDRYLALPYRSRSMDRLLVKLLVAVEFYAFGDEMINEKSFGLPARSPLKQSHVLLGYLRGLLVNAVLFGGVAALALWAGSERWISATAAGWTSAFCVALLLLLSAISTLTLPFVWHTQVKARRKVWDILLQMNTIYNELRSDGPISAQHIRDRANNAIQLGVIWPAPLFAMLDDIIARTGRF